MSDKVVLSRTNGLNPPFYKGCRCCATPHGLTLTSKPQTGAFAGKRGQS